MAKNEIKTFTKVDLLREENMFLKQDIKLLNENKIEDMNLDEYIFKKVMQKIDPIYYIENVLRAHLPEKKRYLHENQIELVKAVCNPSIRRVAALMARQAGKCFAPGTLIMMADGSSKKVEDIQVGDFVMSPNSTPVEVIALGEGYEEMYDIQTEDNQNFTVNKSHILSLKKDKKIINITVENYLTLSTIEKEQLKGYRVDCLVNNKKPTNYEFNFIVKSKGIGKYYGFVINSEDHLFLLDDCTVVHNTESIASFTGYLLDNYPQMRIGIFTPKVQQAEINVGRTSVFYQQNEERLNNKIIKCNKQRIELSNGSYVMAVSGSDQSNIEGLTFDIIILDEAQKISDYTWSERIMPMGLQKLL